MDPNDTVSREDDGWYGKVIGKFDWEDAFNHNLKYIQVAEGEYVSSFFDWEEANTLAGAYALIVHESSSGACDVEVYTNQTDLDARWLEIEDWGWTNICDSCHAEAQEYGKDAEIIHEPNCEEDICPDCGRDGTQPHTPRCPERLARAIEGV
jgi:hypothetical protein